MHLTAAHMEQVLLRLHNNTFVFNIIIMIYPLNHTNNGQDGHTTIRKQLTQQSLGATWQPEFLIIAMTFK